MKEVLSYLCCHNVILAISVFIHRFELRTADTTKTGYFDVSRNLLVKRTFRKRNVHDSLCSRDMENLARYRDFRATPLSLVRS